MSIQKDFEGYSIVRMARFYSGEAYLYMMSANPLIRRDGEDILSRRGEVLGSASKASMKRLRRYLENCKAKYCVMITLTYPLDFPRPVVAKRHLNVFLQWLMRIPGSNSCLWVMEFQKRGAVHFHILSDMGFIEAQRVANQWFVATGGTSNIDAGTRTEKIHGEMKAVSMYLSKYLSKTYQKVGEDGLGDGNVGSGRYWGVRGYDNVHSSEAATLLISTESAEKMLKFAENQHFGTPFENGVWYRYIDAFEFKKMAKMTGSIDVETGELPFLAWSGIEDG